MALVVYAALETRRHAWPREPDAWVTAKAADGWPLLVARYEGAAPKKALPVVLCHGLGANATNLDAIPEYSLARYLKSRGYDTFVLELRGAGRNVGAAPIPWRKRWVHTFDDFVRLDAPAALKAVREATGADQALWVGHSMGGMIAYALAGSPEGAALRGVVAIASPAFFRAPPGTRHLLGLNVLLRGRLRIRTLARLFAPLAAYVPGKRFGSVRSNFDPKLLRQVLHNVLDDMSGALIRQFARWSKDDVFDSNDGRVDYRAGLAKATTPFLLVAGASDDLAPPRGVERVHGLLGSSDKTYRLLSKATGAQMDYGHGDLVFGRDAPGEVFPLVADWLDLHA